MKCSRCQHDNREGAKFCDECAAPLERACAGCGTLVSSAAKFCPECAHPTGQAAAAAEKYGAPEHYTPKHLAEKILLSKAALEGERKQVTVLFADLKGSMELLAERDPEEARKLLDPVLERMMEAVHHYEGTVNQVMGDGIMALFGAPIAHEDHAVRACYAALRMQESLKRDADVMRRMHGVEVQVRVGLNSGEVVVRSVGSDLRMDYTAVGQTTHVAARMEQLAPPGTVRLTEQTVRLAEGYVEVRSLGPVPVKGLPEPIEIFELTGTGQARTRLQATALRGLTRFVGRDTEVEHLRRVLGHAGAGRGQVVAIVGEAGVGKSRLVYEFTHSHRVQGWLILEGSSVSYGKASSYLPVIDLLKGYFKIGNRDDHRVMRDKVLGRVLGLDRALEPLLTPLLALLDVPVDDVAWQNLPPAQRRQRSLDAVKRLLLRESQLQPLMVVFEDLHWIDGESQAFLDSLVESLGSARALLLVNYRPEYAHRWGSRTAYSQLRLDSLAVESAGELLAAFLGQDPGLAPLTKMLEKRGNPFFMEETLRDLVETGVLAGERGAYRLARPVEALQAPATVQAILAARIDRLPIEEKRLLQAASAIGKDVPYALLAAIAEVPEAALRVGLAHLQDAEFLYETRHFPDLEHTFKHALTHDVTYTGLLADRRRALHAQIVEAIERVFLDRLPEHSERLAHHALRGRLWARAVQYGRQAASRALGRAAARDALVYFEQAHIALRELPDGREKAAQFVDLCVEQRDALFRLGESEQAIELLTAARAAAEALDDQRRLVLVLRLEAGHHSFLSRHQSAIELGQRACAVAKTVGAPSLLLQANFILGQALWIGGDNRGALAPLRAALVHSGAVSTTEGGGMVPGVMARSHLPSALAELGEFAEALAIGVEALRIARAASDPTSEIFARMGLGYTQLLQGDHVQALQTIEPAVALCRSLDNRFLLSWVTGALGTACVRTDRRADAIILLEQTIDGYIAMKVVCTRAQSMSRLAEAYLDVGRVGEALELAQQSLALARANREGDREAWCLKVLGDIQAHELAEAVHAGEAYRQALVLATELGLRPLVAHCNFGLGKLHRRAGLYQVANEHLASAMTMYRAMNMRFWLEEAEIELRRLD